MIKLYQQLESTLKIRINSNDEIILALKRLSEMGKFDKPKELAIFAIILDRLGKMEDDKLIEQSLKEEKTNSTITELAYSNESIQNELDEAKKKIEDTVLDTTDSSMTGVSEILPDDTTTSTTEDEQVIPTVTQFNTENITDPQPQNTEPHTT